MFRSFWDNVYLFALLGCIPALIAHFKGRSPFAWWIYGAFLFPIATIHVVLKPRLDVMGRDLSDQIPCPFCKNLVWRDAALCPSCRTDLAAHWIANPSQKPKLSSEPPSTGLAMLWTVLFGIVFVIGIFALIGNMKPDAPVEQKPSAPAAVATQPPNENQLAFARDLGAARAGVALCGLELKPGSYAEEAGRLGIKPYNAPWFDLIAGAESAAKAGAKDKALFCKGVKAQFTGQAVRKWLVVPPPR